MLLMDAGTKKERELSYYVFKSYIDSDDMSEYHAKLKIKIKETGLSINYLKQLRDVYVEKYASESDLIKFEEKKRYYNSKFTEYIAFVERVFDMPKDERFDYLLSSKLTISKVNYYFMLYKKRKCKYYSQVDSFLEEYAKYVQNIVDAKNNDREIEQFRFACALFDAIVDSGAYKVSDYVNKFPKEQRKKIRLEVNSSKKLILSKDEELWNSYCTKIDNNRKIAFGTIKDKVDLFNERLELTTNKLDNVDIIDYYLLIGMPIKDYIELCQGFISNKYITYFKVLSSGFIQSEKESVDENIIINNNYIFGDRNITQSEKLLVLKFLKENNIPLGFYTFAIKKYAEGGLEEYINLKQKILSFN